MLIYSRTAMAQDADGNITNLVTKKNLNALSVSDEEQYDILYNILQEIKKTNFHLYLMTDTYITDGDIELME